MLKTNKCFNQSPLYVYFLNLLCKEVNTGQSEVRSLNLRLGKKKTDEKTKIL